MHVTSGLAGGKTAVTPSDTEDIEYMDQKVDGENNNNVESWVVSKTPSQEVESHDEDEESGEEEVGPGGLRINRVDMRTAPRQPRRALRVCVEISHPALALPLYRTWTGTPSGCWCTASSSQ